MRNILFILADDMGAWALGCTGNNEVKTPNMDRIARKGIAFENAFCVSPVCSPARASLITGRIPSQHGVHDWIRRGNSPGQTMDRACIDYLADELTYTEILARHGYTCGLSGKWHLGNAPVPQKGHDFWEVHASGGGPYYNAPMLRNGEEYQEPRYVTDVITENALEFLSRQQGEQPFCLGVHYTAPHDPWGRDQHPEKYFKPYFEQCPFESVPDLPMHPWQINSASYGYTSEQRREYLSGYYASITAMDAGIGCLLDALESQGILDDTLVVFTSDNGMNMGHHGIYGKGNGTYPQNMYDTSVKVPFLVACPSALPQGLVTDSLFSHYDFFPTLLDFLGYSEDIPRALPGRSRLSLWQGEETEESAAVVVFDEYGPVRMIRDRCGKYVQRLDGHASEYYDLLKDPDEQINRIDDQEYRQRICEAKENLVAWFAKHVDPRKDGAKLPVTGKGQLDLAEAKDAFADDWHYLKEEKAMLAHF